MKKNKKRKIYISAFIFILILVFIGLYSQLSGGLASDQYFQQAREYLGFGTNGESAADNSEKYEHLQQTQFFLDTIVTIDIYVESEEKETGELAMEEAFSVMKYWGEMVDRHEPDSLISEINQSGEMVEVPEGIITMLKKSQKYHELSDGHFDPTVTPLLNLWGFGQEEYHIPSEEEIEQVQEKIGFEKVEINTDKQTVYVPEEMSLDLGAVAKGFIVDEGINTIEERGIDSALINAGGNIAVLGEKPDGPWNLGIKNPREDGQDIFAEHVVSLDSGGLGTSGDYERYFMEDGVRYSHLINPLTGKQVREMRSSTIYAPTALEADILSTTIFIMGWEAGKELIENLPDIQGFMVRDEELWNSEGFTALFRD